MKHEVVVREGDYFLLKIMGSSRIFRCRRVRPVGDVEFVHDRSGLVLGISGGSFASLLRDGKAILVCPAIMEAEGHSGGTRATKRNPSRSANVPRWGQPFLFSAAGGTSRLYVFKGLLPGRILSFTDVRNRRAIALSEGVFESWRRRGRVVPFRLGREAIQEYLRNFGKTMAPAKGFDHPPSHTGQTRH